MDEALIGILAIACKIAEGKEPLEIAYLASLYGQLAETLDTLAIKKEYLEFLEEKELLKK